MSNGREGRNGAKVKGYKGKRAEGGKEEIRNGVR